MLKGQNEDIRLRCYVFPVHERHVYLLKQKKTADDESWTLNNDLIQRINVFEQWCYRRLLRIQESPASLTNPRDAKVCQKLLQFDVLTTLSQTILAYLYSFSCCCVRNLRNSAKFTENSNLWSSRSSKVIDLGVNRKPMYDFLLVTNSNFGRICYRFRDIDA